MPLKTKVLVGNITNLSEARYCAGMGVDILSFPIGNEVRGISIDKFREIAEWVVGPQFALELLTPIDEQTLNVVTQEESIDYIETTLDSLTLVADAGYKGNFILSLGGEQLEQLQQHDLAQIKLILADISPSDLPRLESLNKRIPVFVKMNKENHELQSILNSSLSGIGLEGSEEVASGNKTYDHLADILEVLDVE